MAGSGVTINNLLPGVHDTDRIKTTDAGIMKQTGKSLEEVQAQRSASIPAVLN